MSITLNELNRKSSFKVYKSPRLGPNEDTSDNKYRGIFQKEKTSKYTKKDNFIYNTEPTQNLINTSNKNQQEKIVTNTVTRVTRYNQVTEEKKPMQNSISSKYYKVQNKKEESGLNKNYSNNKSTIRINQLQNTNMVNGINNNMHKASYYSIKDLKLENNADNKYNNNKRSYQVNYIDRRQNKTDNDKYLRPKSQSKTQISKIDTQTKYQIKTLPYTNKNDKHLKQSKSQSQIKYVINSSNVNNYNINGIPISINSYARKTPNVFEVKNVGSIYTSNINKTLNTKNQERMSTEPGQAYNVYKSGSSYHNTQNKNDNYSNKVNNNSSRQNTYVQSNYKYNAYNTQNKNNNKYEYKPSYADSQRINTESNYKRYNQVYPNNQAGSRRDKTPDLNMRKNNIITSDIYKRSNNDVKNMPNKSYLNYQVNYNTTKNNYIVESKNINKYNNYDKYKYNYKVNTNISSSSARPTDTKKNDYLKTENHYKITYNLNDPQKYKNTTNKAYNTTEQNYNCVSKYSNYDKNNKNTNIESKYYVSSNYQKI